MAAAEDGEIERLRSRLERERAARLEAEAIAEKMTRELQEKMEMLRASTAKLQEAEQEVLALSTPVLQIWARMIALPLIGTLDSRRAQQMTEALLQAMTEQGAEIVILDISGVPVMDTAVAGHLLRTAQATMLMGGHPIISGIRPEIALILAGLGADFAGVRTCARLSDALRLGLGELGLQVAQRALPHGGSGEAEEAKA